MSKYELTDIVGKAAKRSWKEEYLQGTKGYETVFVDRMGREARSALTMWTRLPETTFT